MDLEEQDTLLSEVQDALAESAPDDAAAQEEAARLEPYLELLREVPEFPRRGTQKRRQSLRERRAFRGKIRKIFGAEYFFSRSAEMARG